jgi:hypothetical protein
MATRGEATSPVPYDPAGIFAGDLFLTLAVEGRLVLEAGQADQVIAGLETALHEVTARVRVLELWRRSPGRLVRDADADVGQAVADAAFADQMAPGRLEQALRELPKYVEALRAARRPPRPTR